jgi:hypothetical protein
LLAQQCCTAAPDPETRHSKIGINTYPLTLIHVNTQASKGTRDA